MAYTLCGRRFYIEQALMAARRLEPEGYSDCMHVGTVIGALEYLLERWNEWDVVEKGGPHGQTDVGAGGSEVGAEVRGGAGGGSGEDVPAGYRWTDGGWYSEGDAYEKVQATGTDGGHTASDSGPTSCPIIHLGNYVKLMS